MIFLLTLTLSFIYSIAALAINTVDTGFRVAPDELKTIVAHGVCKKVWNNDVRDHFVATKTNMEWTNFYVNHPLTLTVRDCYATCSNLKKMGSATSGIYSLDIDGPGVLSAMNLYCDLDSDGGGWTRVFRHNIAGGYFATTTAALNANSSDPNNNLYSILGLLDYFKSINRFTFRLYYPEPNKRNIWSQLSNPVADSALIGYRGISIDDSSRYWGGLELSNKSSGITNINRSLLDGSIEHSDWWFAIGSTSVYSGGIPALGRFQEIVSEVELYVHDSGYYPQSCQHLLEMGESKGNGLYTIYPDQLNPVLTYCEMGLDNGGWTLFYANAADAAMTVKKSYNQHKNELAGLTIPSSDYTNVNTVGMLNYKHFAASDIMARDIGNWGALGFSTLEFQNPLHLQHFVSQSMVPANGTCKNMRGAGMFRFRNSNGTNYWFDQMNDYAGTNTGLGWGDCHPNGVDQTDAPDIENYPRHWFYDVAGNTDSNRVRGIGGFNFGSTTAKARYFLREKLDRPKNCMDILLAGNSKGSGSYIIYPEGTPVTVDCDMVTQGGGWTKVWHGYPSHARYLDSSLETYSRSNSIAFNQMRMEGVNIGVNIVDSTWKTAYLDKTIPEYFKQVIDQSDASIPQVKFADFSGTENVGLVGRYFLKGYGNNWRVFYTCVNVDPQTADRLFIGGQYNPKCPVTGTFVSSSISTCTSTSNWYCTNSMASTEVDTGMGLTLKKYQETRVWVRSLDSMRSCREILDRGFASGNGVYLIDPDGPTGATEPFPTYCDMTSQGGGWTLVWSNTRLGTNKPTTSLSYNDSINTRPRCSYAQSSVNDFTGNCTPLSEPGGPSAPWLERFNYFLGLKHWDDISAGTDFELKYSWSADYGRALDREAIMRVKNFAPADFYRLTSVSYRNTIGADTAGIYTYNGNRWTALDSDNDSHASNCGTIYSSTPFWYHACWAGSINGGGENDTTTYFNGAHWRSSAQQWGDGASGLGAGNGWIFIREAKSEGRLKSSCKEILQDNPNSPSGVYTIDFTVGGTSNQLTVYCDMTTSGGGWTLVAYSNGTVTADTPATFFAGAFNRVYVSEYTRANYQASLNPELFSLSVGTTDAMFVSPSYNGGVPIIDTNFGPWDYDQVKCSGNLRHTSRTAGCAGQGANDNFDSSDYLNISFFNGTEGIVPSYPETCYSGKGSCSFQFYLR